MKTPKSDETKKKFSLARSKKYKYLTPTGDIQYMTKTQATRYHSDWKLLEN